MSPSNLGVSGGTDPFNPSGAADQGAALQALLGGGKGGEDPMGGPSQGLDSIRGGSNPMGEHDRQGNGSDAGTDDADEGDGDDAVAGRIAPKGKKANKQPAGRQAGKPAAAQPQRPAVAGGNKQAVEVSDEDYKFLEGHFSKSHIQSMVKRFGEEGLTQLREEAEAFYEENAIEDEEGTQASGRSRSDQGDSRARRASDQESAADEGEDGAEGDDYDLQDGRDGQADDDGDTQDDQRAARQRKPEREWADGDRRPPRRRAEQDRGDGGRYGDVVPTRESLEHVQNILGEGPYREVVAPLLRAAKRGREAETRIAKAEATMTKHIKWVDDAFKTLDRMQMHHALDRVNDEMLGNSFEGLNARQSTIRAEVVREANRELGRNPKAGHKQAILYAIQVVSRRRESQNGRNGSNRAAATQINNNRAGRVGAVPQGGRSSSVQSGRGNPAPAQGMGAALSLLQTYLPQIA